MTNIKNRMCVRAVPAVIFAALTAMLLLGGCVRKYTRSSIGAYAKKISGRSSLSVSEGYLEIQEDEEGYLDHLWTVRDKVSGVTFHVLDDYYWSMEKVENRLLNDYDSSVFLHLLEQKKLPSEEGLSLKKTEESGLVSAEVTCSFKDSEGLRDCYEKLLRLRQAAEEAGFPDLQVTYTVRYKNPLRGAVDYEVDEGDSTGMLGSLQEEDYERMRSNYLACALNYRFEDALAEFSQEEIDALVHAPETVRIYRTDGEQGIGEYYEGVIGNPRYAGISFGTLYELLRMEGRAPKGSPWHYSVKAPDGSTLEFSYDFNDLSGFNDKQGKLQKGYYYMRDDRKVRMDAYYENHFEASEIEALTGLKVAEDRPYVTR